ncbi:hypothetical protein Dda3937_04492 [Dickeya dadantii 3937]|uniref:Uncharacterized protein n=1 Tax=Dickeya dadantii (strain 3937) TaxID=198628 RepID=E0SD81_DICD3|nr:hypothetical protein Dda3937_04492 [Dickeya dadantii 3937]
MQCAALKPSATHYFCASRAPVFPVHCPYFIQSSSVLSLTGRVLSLLLRFNIYGTRFALSDAWTYLRVTGAGLNLHG